jgi:hypothetical protein
MNKPLWKQAAEMYALKMIAPEQVLEECENLQQAKEAFEYAEDYGAQYDLWCECMRKKYTEVETDWFNAEQSLLLSSIKYSESEIQDMRYDEIYVSLYNYHTQHMGSKYWEDYEAAKAETHSSYYTEEELQAAFDAFSNHRREQIIRIGKEAHYKYPWNDPVINRFFKEYNLNGIERTIFWCAYNGTFV